MWTNLTFRGFDYGWQSYQRPPRLPHVVSICTSPPIDEPLTLDEAKLRAGFTWPSPDERDDLITSFISAARQQVEHDTGLALLLQTREVYFDVVTSSVIILPEHSLPLQDVTSVAWTDMDGTSTTLDPTEYVVDYVSGRIQLGSTFALPPPNVRSFQAWKIIIEAGWPDPATLRDHEPKLWHMVGLLIAHWSTLGRDLASIERGTLDKIPMGYDELLAAYAPIAVI